MSAVPCTMFSWGAVERMQSIEKTSTPGFKTCHTDSNSREPPGFIRSTSTKIDPSTNKKKKRKQSRYDHTTV